MNVPMTIDSLGMNRSKISKFHAPRKRVMLVETQGVATTPDRQRPPLHSLIDS
ncbi:hypothetical protein [Bacillus sp. ISL-7]|uniref:hypothetical protein n=1 Tax=Bacillus sp. ISL-7 TaxID=2819136 RepID=UPI001BECC852|nr:hypothetical protein [Bacillus sp. ISL-7]MBT2735998.1 hypothetical protein [Bacillus sp. ISL-7]